MSTCLTLPLLFLFRPFSEKDIVSCSLCSVCLENQKEFVLLCFSYDIAQNRKTICIFLALL